MRNVLKKLLFAIIPVLMMVPLSTAWATQINLNYNISSYKYMSDSLYVVFSFSFPQEEPKYVKYEDIYVACLSLEVDLTSEEHSAHNQWQIDLAAQNPGEKAGKLFIGTKGFAIHEGDYEIKIKLTDLNDKSVAATFEDERNFEKYGFDDLQMSDIELGYQIEKTANLKHDINPDFVKADLYFIPNPSNEIYGVSPELITYTEIYNYHKEKYDSLVFNYDIKNSMRQSVWTQSRKRSPKAQEFYDIFLIVPDTIPSGTYYMDITANCFKNNQIVDSCKSRKKFYLMNPQRSPELNTYFSEDEQYARSEFATFTDEQCELEFAQIRVIASIAERDIWSKLKDYSAKKKYLYAFWNNRKDDKNVNENRSREEFRKRIDQANLYYNEGGSGGGWNTDRGRILMKYGEPTSVDSYPTKDGNKPYEVWNYQHIAGGVKMYFVDVHLSGRYKLVHSTHYDEVQNSDWETRILPLNRTNTSNEY